MVLKFVTKPNGVNGNFTEFDYFNKLIGFASEDNDNEISNVQKLDLWETNTK